MKENIKKNNDLNTIKFKKGELLAEVEELSGENLFACYQCGTCSAGCPFIEDMDLGPDEVIRLSLIHI